MRSIARQAAEYWRGNDERATGMAHWRGSRRWAYRDAEWLGIGKKHLKMHLDLLRSFPPKTDMRRMLEWGPGGGSNVLAFANEFEDIMGVDISADTLTECRRQASKVSDPSRFSTLTIDVDHPEAVSGSGPFDFMLCTAVVQHMPSKDLVQRFLSAAAGEMTLFGRALVQYREPRPTMAERYTSESDRYADNPTHWCMFTEQEFRSMCNYAGWIVLERVGNPIGSSGYMFVYLERR